MYNMEVSDVTPEAFSGVERGLISTEYVQLVSEPLPHFSVFCGQL